ncbi:CBS domain-containing protein [Desulfosporosinus orientis DSM 765]|uniref:CBS domain-containing protein n=1 Tax=Desulfosporosinus orientis (strain ATCC 19365 / DSM 765 / NCIMB 8382 / VKM B-1628 / Singapore I) TaxID=768706 RepID=G7WG66_DESOD|nr:CBS domain-containing protein [Desulfosporosinus orientis]AET70160.1 CBS domain-containing protein [Desulfosporosinus orientis DSM 765]
MKITLGQIMVPLDEYPIVSEEESLEKAIELLTEEFKQRDNRWHNFEAVLTTNSEGEITGMLTLRFALDAVRELKFPSLRHRLAELFAEEPVKRSPLQVKDILHPLKSRLIDISVELDEAIAFLLKHNLNSILVAKNQQIVGVVRTMDLFWYIGDVL